MTEFAYFSLFPSPSQRHLRRLRNAQLVLHSLPQTLRIKFLASTSQARPILPCDELLLSPVDGTVSVLEEHLHPSDSVQLRQVKGVRYSLRSFLSRPFRMRSGHCPALLTRRPLQLALFRRALSLSRRLPPHPRPRGTGHRRARAHPRPSSPRPGGLRRPREGSVHAERARRASRRVAARLLRAGHGRRLQRRLYPRPQRSRAHQSSARAAVRGPRAPESVRAAVAGRAGRARRDVRAGVDGGAGLRGAAVHLAGGAGAEGARGTAHRVCAPLAAGKGDRGNRVPRHGGNGETGKPGRGRKGHAA